MNYSKVFLAGIVGMVLHGSASAQIYESKDDQGNPVFSDEATAGAGAEEVDLQQTNLADPPPDVPEPAPAKEAASEQGGVAPSEAVPGEAGGQDYYYGGATDETRRRLEEEKRRRDIPDGDKPLDEVLPEGKPHRPARAHPHVGHGRK